jgi:hypothetical protein
MTCTRGNLQLFQLLAARMFRFFRPLGPSRFIHQGIGLQKNQILIENFCPVGLTHPVQTKPVLKRRTKLLHLPVLLEQRGFR